MGAAPARPAGERTSGLRFTVKDSGSHSRAAAGLAPGTRVVVEGPYGAGTLARKRRAGTVLIAAGIGITPLRALLEALGPRARDATLIYRSPADGDMLFRAEIAAIERDRGATIHHVVGPCGSATDLTARRLCELAPHIAESDVFVCGPPSFAAAVRDAVREAGTPARDIHVEGFGW